MITIVITKQDTINYTEKQNHLLRKTPTDKRKTSTSQSYSNNQGPITTDEPVMEEQYELHDVPKTKTEERVLLRQELDEADFDLKAVIQAVNGLTK